MGMREDRRAKKDRNAFTRFVFQIRSIANEPRVRNTIKIGSDVFNAIAPAVENPSKWNVARSVFNVGKAIIDYYEMYADDFFQGSYDWRAPYATDFSPLIQRAFGQHPYVTMNSGVRDSYVKVVDLDDGCKIGWTVWEKLQMHVSSVYVHVDNYEQTRQKIKIALWEMYKDQSLAMRRCDKKIFRSNDDSLPVSFEPDVLFAPLPSQRARDYSEYLRRCLDAGVARSVMFYGPPGTGKSTMACTVVHNLGLRSFRIRIGDLERIDNSALFDAIDIFAPDAVILDDFDRAQKQDDLLEVLEYFQQRVKLVIATVNDKKEIDQAILRPGRFDELLNVKFLDEEVVKGVLGEANADVFDTVKEWPIAFIHELVKRRRFMSAADALAATIELQRRVTRLKSYDDDAELPDEDRFKPAEKDLLKKITEISPEQRSIVRGRRAFYKSSLRKRAIDRAKALKRIASR